MTRCVRITSAQAAQIMGAPGPYTLFPYKELPCPAYWTSPVKWEQREGPDSLDGKPSDASVDATYVDFPDSAAAQAEYNAIHAAAVDHQVDPRGNKRRTVTPVDASGDAEAFLSVPVPAVLNVESSATEEFFILGRCGSRMLRISAEKMVFYAAVKHGHAPNEENIVHRGRVPVPVDRNLRAAYAMFGAPLCAGEDLPSIPVRPYQRIAK